ncbi:MAG: leucyl/phenylalanyl-tRNA--protein transferase [Ignavibacteria bacterium]|nr:leucyl/phenylalanyl-tRNA--protein transferase [Ignavibacteria bacterium]
MNSKDKFNPRDFLQPYNMLRLYASGAFPMADEEKGGINWYLPDVRTIIPLIDLKVPRTARKAIEKMNFKVKIDKDFDGVVNGCANRESTWISEELIKAYKRLKRRGHVHTVETYLNNELVGGLYGITFRGAFFGESMFSKVSEASKAALVALLQHLKQKDFVLLDVQYMTEHLKMFGAIEISFDEYTKLLHQSYTRACEF